MKIEAFTLEKVCAATMPALQPPFSEDRVCIIFKGPDFLN